MVRSIGEVLITKLQRVWFKFKGVFQKVLVHEILGCLGYQVLKTEGTIRKRIANPIHLAAKQQPD